MNLKFEENTSITFFGTLKDGFKIYPYSSSVYNRLSIFSNQSSTGSRLEVIRYEKSIIYIYVEYGLVTSFENGRPGSCFGISIAFSKKYFNSPEIFFSKICKQIFQTLVSEKEILIKNEVTGLIGYLPKDFERVSDVLNEWDERIRAVLSNNYLNYFSPISEVNLFNGIKVDHVNVQSSAKVIIEILKEKGAIILSADAPVLQKSKVDYLLEENDSLRHQIVDLESEINRLQNVIASQKSEINKTNSKRKLNYKQTADENIGEHEENVENVSSVAKDLANRSQQKVDRLLKLEEDNSSAIESKQKKKFNWWPILVLTMIAILLFYFLSRPDDDPSRKRANRAYDATGTKNSFTESSCHWNGPFRRWQYRGSNIIDIKSLAYQVLRSIDLEKCSDLFDKLIDNIVANNPSDIKNGKFLRSGNIIFYLPVQYYLTDKSFETDN